MSVVLNALLPFFALIFAGGLIARFAGFTPQDTRGLSRLVFWHGMPAVLIVAFIKQDAAHHLDPKLASAYCAACLTGLIGFRALGQLLKRPREDLAGIAMTGVLGNTAFFAFPLVQFVFGPEAALAGAVILLVDNLLILPLAVAGLTAIPGHAGWASFAQIARSTVTNPIVLASALGFVLSAANVHIPAAAMRTLEMMAGAATPAALLALGATLTHSREEIDQKIGVSVGIAVIAKLVLLPLFVFAAATLCDVDPFARAVATLAAGAPTAVNVFIQARSYNRFATGAARVVALSTLFSAASLAVLIVFLT